MADYWSMALDGGTLEQVQSPAPVPRPAPIPRPGFEMGGTQQRRQPASPDAKPQPSTDYWGKATETQQTPVQPPSQPQQSGVDAEPDAKSWTGRVVQTIRGKQDPRYTDIPTIAEVTINEGINKPMSESAAWLAGTSDKGMVGTYKDMLGDRFLGTEQDANGYPLIVYRGQDGQPQRAYVNKPGLDMQDVVRGVEGVAPYVGAGRLVGKGLKGIEAGLGFRTLAQSITQAGTSVAQDVGNMLLGGDNPDMRDVGKKATAAGLFGAGGEIAGAAVPALWRRFVTEPSLFDRSTGQLTQKGALAASEAGLDASALTAELRQQFAKELARTGSADTAARGVTNSEFGIAKTRGELSGDMPTLLREQHIRGGNYGEQAAGMMQNFDRNQQKQVSDAILGEIATSSGTTRPGIAQRLAPGRTSADYSKAEMGSAIRQNTENAFETAKAAERQAWEGVKDLRPTDEAMPLLKQRLNEAIGEFPIPQGLKAEMMEKELDAFLKGQAPAKVSEWRDANPIGSIDQMRKRLSKIQRGATDPTDREAAGALMEGFNNWVRDAAEQALLKGDPQSAANMVVARGLTRELHQVFDGPQGSPAARILSDVLKKADSAEGVVNALFTGPTAQTKGGTVAALKNLKTAYDKYLEPEAAKAAWDDIRLAYFLRMVQSKGGEAVGVQQLQSNIKQALATQQSVSQLLYAPEEIAMLQRFLRATAGIERKNPNKPWSGVAAGGIIKDMVGSLISAFGFKSVVAKAGFNMAGGQIMKRAYGPAAAANATSGTMPALPAPSFAGYGGAYGARSQDQ